MAKKAKSSGKLTGIPLIRQPELFVGLVGAVGTNLDQVVQALRSEFTKVQYSAEEIRFSRLLHKIPRYAHLAKMGAAPEDERIDSHMRAGDDLRETTQRGDALVVLAVSAIQELRVKKIGERNAPCYGTVFILNSLKHPDEIETLRQIYGQAFIAVSVYEPKMQRRKNLAIKIAKSRKDHDHEKFEKRADELIDTDQFAGKTGFGQNVRETFPKGDVFIRAGDETKIRTEIERLVRVQFGYQFITPTRDELAMALARTYALRSADLSRQVGAVLSNELGDILSVGCNEVPKTSGGSVWPEAMAHKDDDQRDFRLTYDSSVRFRDEIIAEVMETLRQHRWLKGKLNLKRGEELKDLALYGEDGSIFSGARVASLLEYGRIVHAEMAALMDAAQRGIPTRGATLYCTTFPCHMCARHLLSAGVQRVVYIEPYPKSLAKELYERDIQVDEDQAGHDALRFESFVGIAPRRFAQSFEMPKRKDERGIALDWDIATAVPKLARINNAYLDNEMALIASFETSLERLAKAGKLAVAN